MKLSRSHLLYVQTKYIADLLAIFIAFGIAYLFYQASMVEVAQRWIFLGTLIITLAWFIASFFSNLYLDRRTKKFSEEIIVSFYNAVITVLISSSAFFFLMRDRNIENGYWISFFSTILLCSIIFKYIIRKYTHYLIYKGELAEHFILVGYTQAGSGFIDTVNRFKYYGYNCTGIVHDEPVQHEGIPYLGKIADLEQIIMTNPIQEYVLALSNDNAGLVKKIIQVCDQHQRKVRLIPDLETYTNANIEVANLGIMPVLNYKSLPLDRWESRVIKRGFDLTFSLFYLILKGFLSH
jgi:putative colanic acid biosynthesis UDP-glucose lipid carrier transferase